MKLKIKCNGSAESAVVVNAATDEIVDNVLGVELSLTPFQVEAVLLIKDVELDLDNIEAQEVNIDKPTWNDRGAGTPDD